MKIFLNAVGFLTVFRVSDKSYLDDNSFYKTLYYFPFVGFLIGLFGAAVYFISGFIFPGFLCLILAVLAEVFISGGMHLDGLSDTADGIFSGRKDKEKIIEIMKKSDIGAFGAISLVFLFILKITLLYSIFFIALKNIEGINILKNINH
ncbi:MAG: adenosylcobinamide-GDP ribazoletransferase, partial [Actinomycetota bacterium]|nr:adenosylcobinamide-GDP ribazoletransferase [Actinomycetota bacterium]